MEWSDMAQHQPVARIEALYRNEWPGSAIRRPSHAGSAEEIPAATMEAFDLAIEAWAVGLRIARSRWLSRKEVY